MIAAFVLSAVLLGQQEPKVPAPRVQDPVVPPPVTLPSDGKAETSGPVTADEVARLALRLQPSIASALGQVETTRGKATQAQAPLHPQLVLGAGYDSLQSLSGNGATSVQAPTGTTPSGVSSSYAASGTAAIKQLVFDFDQTRNLVRQSRALADASLANLGRAQQDIAWNAKNAFYALLNAQRQLKVANDNLTNRQRQLDLANARLRNQIGLPIDVVTAETSKSQAVLALAIARDAEQQARVTLLQSIGVDPFTPIETATVDEAAVPSSDAHALIVEGLKRRPEVQQAEFNVVASKYGLSAARSTNMPALYASVAAGVAGNDFPLKNNVLSFGIGVQFTLSDGGQRSGAITAAKGQVSTAEADLKTVLLNVKSDISGAYLLLQSAELRVATADAEVGNAVEGLRIAEGRYAAGLGTFQDITTAQGQLVTAQQDQATVKNTLNLARTRLRHAIGNTLGN